MTAEPITSWKPQDDRIIVEVHEAEGVSPGGVVLANAQKRPIGTVLAVGENATVKVGDEVQFATFSGIEEEIDDREVIILRQADIVLVKA
jgi:co-chaperonin GroES (HSP10)